MKPYFANTTASIAAALALNLLCAAAPISAAVQARRPPTPVIADAPAIKRAIASYGGHVVVVNFWATWCPQCVAEFPALVRLSDRYASRGLVVIAVSADQGKEFVPRVAPFLSKQKAHFPVFILSGDQEKAVDAFDPTWQGDLPRTFIYDKHGRLVKTLVDEQTYATFTSRCEDVVKL